MNAVKNERPLMGLSSHLASAAHRHNVRSLGRSTHRFQRSHGLGVIVIEQMRVNRQRCRHLRVSQEREICSGGMPAATHKLA